MKLIRKTIRYDEIGLVYRNGRLTRVLGEGVTWLASLRRDLRVEVLNERDPWIRTTELDQLGRSGLVSDRAIFAFLTDRERALVWIDGRLDAVLGPGRHGLWTRFKNVRLERLDASSPRLEREDLSLILGLAGASSLLETVEVPEGSVGLLYVNGAYRDTLAAGTHALWRGLAKAKVFRFDQREQVLDVSGQDIMTQDKVTLRLNAVLTYRVSDARRAVEATSDVTQALYRETQLVLRAQVGGRGLDALLADKTALADTALEVLRQRAAELGVRVQALGIRDVILPGEMKELLNQVIEAQKAAEANGVRRREETAAMRSQLNTARLMEGNPVLMRLRELEVLETIAKTSRLQVVLGEQGLTERLTKMI
jgi:regulator of protease activity HflC (stomatin/prohibitin superfamily)